MRRRAKRRTAASAIAPHALARDLQPSVNGDLVRLRQFSLGLGMCTVSTPSLLSQRTASVLIFSGSEKVRLKLP